MTRKTITALETALKHVEKGFCAIRDAGPLTPSR
jgi:hypothetical protein